MSDYTVTKNLIQFIINLDVIVSARVSAGELIEITLRGGETHGRRI